jgi:hypothetical protein
MSFDRYFRQKNLQPPDFFTVRAWGFGEKSGNVVQKNVLCYCLIHTVILSLLA